MNKVIYKFALSQGLSRHDLPKHSKVISADIQHGNIQMWALVPQYPSSRETESFEFRVVGTGHALEDGFENVYDIVNTVIDGPLVWHIFQKVPHKNLRELAKAGT